MTGPMLAALLALAPQAGLSGSSDPRSEADFQCYGAALLMAGSAEESDTELVNAASMVGFYYLGRLEGREPGVDWPGRGAAIQDDKSDAFMAHLQRCATEFEAKGQELIAAGDKAAAAS